jgi:exodeoxyribonuclease V alpha subunit
MKEVFSEVMDILNGAVERITYYNGENGYSVIRLKPERPQAAPGLGRDGLVTVTGNLPELSPGEHVHLRGRWSNHAKHGMQFQVEVCEQSLPATTAGIRRYLGSGLIKGIGPRLAERIVEKFGAHTLDIIERQPERLREVSDIGPKRVGLIAAAWEEQKQVKEIMLFLHSHGVSTNLAVKIYKQYGDQALEVVQSDPYRLARDIFGIGFKTADKIAQALGLASDHPSRIEAGLVYVLNEMSSEGHVYSPQELLFERAVELLGVSSDLLPPGLARLAQEDRIRQDQLPLPAAAGHAAAHSAIGKSAPAVGVREEPAPYLPERPQLVTAAVYLTPFYFGELGAAERLKTLASAPARLSRLGLSVFLDPLLSQEQKEAIQTSLSRPVSVLTGGPGTGKTTCLKALIAAVESAKKTFALASPTGRAAKRLSEATGRPASTIHRLLGFVPGEGFKFNAENPLPVDLLVVDEVSMLDLLLSNHLLKSLRPGTHLLLVGDVDQLPSVGAGDVLRDLIASQVVPVSRLSQIFRQAAGSFIITNAHRINQGQMPLFPGAAAEGQGQKSDFFLFPAETAAEAAAWVQDVVCERIPQKFGLHPLEHIQVLAPMYRGEAGVTALNGRLQAALNPSESKKPEKNLFGQVFRVGDKVMQIQNNYDKDVYNGDIGRLVDLNLVDHTLSVSYEGKKVVYDWNDADQLVLAYAVSVHKAQGSEFPVVVLPLVMQHYMMLQRNLLYTAITRARQLCVLVGSRRAIGQAVRSNAVAGRYTALDWRLQAQKIPDTGSPGQP